MEAGKILFDTNPMSMVCSIVCSHDRSNQPGTGRTILVAAGKAAWQMARAAVFSIGSDGTDGPTDAAGGYVDYSTMKELSEQGIDVFSVLKENDAYHALGKVGGLVMTGPTGTNVNDVAVALIG